MFRNGNNIDDKDVIHELAMILILIMQMVFRFVVVVLVSYW